MGGAGGDCLQYDQDVSDGLESTEDQHGDHSERSLRKARKDVHGQKYDEQALIEEIVVQLMNV